MRVIRHSDLGGTCANPEHYSDLTHGASIYKRNSILLGRIYGTAALPIIRLEIAIGPDYIVLPARALVDLVRCFGEDAIFMADVFGTDADGHETIVGQVATVVIGERWWA